MDDRVALGGDFELSRDFAVRSAGFPASGLTAFGPGDEGERLREVARDPVFREAVTWQNPAALANAVARIADGLPAKPSRTRQREEIVASYWQRYCAKNDTIGFFGPLAWGRIADDGPPLAARSGALVSARAVHLEAWAVQALAAQIDPELVIATGPRAEDELRAQLEAHADHAVRERGLAALDRLVQARDALSVAPREGLTEALAALDAVFVELTGRDPVRNPGRAYGARTLAYVDCMRDLNVTMGPQLVAELAPALQVMFEASRWYCGQVNTIGRRVIERALPDGRGPFMPVLIEVLRTLMSLPPELAGECAELQRRMSTLLADPDPATVGARAAALFSDHAEAWPLAVHHSADVQIAAADEAAVAAGDYLAVIGDVHPGSNPLTQGVFAHRHPDPAGSLAEFAAAVGPTIAYLLPPWGPGLGVDARGVVVLPADAISIAAMPGVRALGGGQTWLPHELLVDGEDLVDRAGAMRVPLMEVFGMPIFVTAVRTFDLLPDEDHAPRLTIGRTVLRREGWSVPARDVPQRAQDVAAFARDRGMPQRVFAKSPLERKPMYLDIESPVLGRILCRHARQAAAAADDARIAFTEMLPTPEQSWLRDAAGERYVCELRLVAVDVAVTPRVRRCAPRPVPTRPSA
jgi:hypothetical protein